MAGLWEMDCQAEAADCRHRVPCRRMVSSTASISSRTTSAATTPTPAATTPTPAATTHTARVPPAALLRPIVRGEQSLRTVLQRSVTGVVLNRRTGEVGLGCEGDWLLQIHRIQRKIATGKLKLPQHLFACHLRSLQPRRQHACWMWFRFGQSPDLTMNVMMQSVSRSISPLHQVGICKLRPILGDPSLALSRGVHLNTCSSGRKDQEKNSKQTKRDALEITRGPGCFTSHPRNSSAHELCNCEAKELRGGFCSKRCAICVKVANRFPLQRSSWNSISSLFMQISACC